MDKKSGNDHDSEEEDGSAILAESVCNSAIQRISVLQVVTNAWAADRRGC